MATRPAQTTKRSSVAAAELAPRPPCQIHSLAIISDKAQISGIHQVIIGENSILHPYARIRSDHGRVIIGRDTVVCEKAVVGAAGPAAQGSADVSIADGVNIESGAVVEAASVGTGTVIEVGAIVGRNAMVGKHCKITSLNEINPGEELPDYSVVFGDGQRRVDTTMATNAEIRDAKLKGQTMYIELLKRLIPNAANKWG